MGWDGKEFLRYCDYWGSVVAVRHVEKLAVSCGFRAARSDGFKGGSCLGADSESEVFVMLKDEENMSYVDPNPSISVL